MQYLASEIGTGLRRNLTMTIAVVMTVAISLALFGAGLLIRAQAETMKDFWYDRIEISVFLCNDFDTGATCASGAVSDEEREAIRDTLESNPEVEEVFVESQEEAYELFRDRFDDSIADNITPEQLQESFRIKLVNPEEFEGVVSSVAGLAGVAQVVDQRALLDRFFRLLNGFQVAALAIAAVQVFAAVLLISNTIRVAAFSRRRETGIMKLVGASSWSIQLPFILEAAIAGLIGGILASLVLIGFQAFFIEDILVPAFQFTAWVGWSDVWQIVPIMLLTGTGIAAIASFVTLRRYLKV
ncbi:MAG: permease-like cell division protein FtsX [Jiangellales bacterium]